MKWTFKMLTPVKATRLALIVLASLTMSSCAMWPTLKDDKDLKPAAANEILCRTDDFDTAYKCAAATHAELSDLVDGVGDYNRSSSYAAWVLGTATGGVLAFDGGESGLKGLAVGAGGLIGLNSVVKTDEQIRVVSKAKDELNCVMTVAKQVHAAGTSPLITHLPTHAIAAVQSIQGAQVQALEKFAAIARPPSVAELVASEMARINATTVDLKFIEMSKTSEAVASSVNSANAGLGIELSNAVFVIRDRVRAALAGMSVSDEKTMLDQRNHVVDMAGEIIRKRADVRKQKDAAPATGEPGQAAAAQVAQEALNGTAGVEESFKQCVDPATAAALSS